MNAIKLAPNGAIEAYAVRWGNPDQPDRSRTRDYFTKETDLMLNEWGWPRPVLLEHMVTPEGERAGSVGQWHGAFKDSVGVKLHGQLNTGHPMYPTLARDIQAGKYFLSSDSAPHLVKRRPMPNGTNELTRWGLLTASLTKNPAEGRLLPAMMVKALALKAPRPLRLSNPDLFYAVVAEEKGFSYAVQLKRRFDLEDRLKRLELEARLERLQETPEARKARLLRECEKLAPGRHARASIVQPGPLAGTHQTPFDMNADSGRRTW